MMSFCAWGFESASASPTAAGSNFTGDNDGDDDNDDDGSESLAAPARFERWSADRGARIERLRAELLEAQTNGFKPATSSHEKEKKLKKNKGEERQETGSGEVVDGDELRVESADGDGDGDGDGNDGVREGGGEGGEDGQNTSSAKSREKKTSVHERLAAETKGALYRDAGAYADHEAALAAVRAGPAAYPSTPCTGSGSGSGSGGGGGDDGGGSAGGGGDGGGGGGGAVTSQSGVDCGRRHPPLTPQHAEARLRERLRAAANEAAAAGREGNETAVGKLSAASSAAHARRVRTLLLEAVALHQPGRAVIYRSEVGPVLRSVGLLPEAPVTQAARRDEARLVYRLCACLSLAAATSIEERLHRDRHTGGSGGEEGMVDAQSDMPVPLDLFCRFVGAGTVSSLSQFLPTPTPHPPPPPSVFIVERLKVT